MALKRLKSLWHKLSQQPTLRQQYCDAIAKEQQRGYVRKLSPEEIQTMMNTQHWFLPHFCVFHPDKPEPRIVFDAAAKIQGVSCNALLRAGPNLLETLLGVLFRFRLGALAITADVEQFYHRVAHGFANIHVGFCVAAVVTVGGAAF